LADAFSPTPPSVTTRPPRRTLREPKFHLGRECLILLTVIFAVSPHVRAADVKPTPVDQLPSIPQLPDPFLFPDGSRVKDKADWQRRREQIKQMVLAYEYGHPAPDPGNVKVAQEVWSIRGDVAGSVERVFVLTMGPEGKISISVALTLPPGKGPFPVIVKGDLCWGRVKPEIVADIVKRGYALAEFDRTQIAPDDKTRDKGVLAAYPDSDEGDLAAWAWGFSRVVDYLLTQDNIDKDKIIVTGHSRGGKAALLAGALDERVALTVPNGSGAGGAGCFRVQPPKTEDLQKIATRFPNWFGPRFHEFIDHVDQLPFDQHEVRALVAPRALLTTDGLGDIWANGPGTQATYLASKEVYTFLGVPDKIGIHYREGKHDQLADDFTALLDFADHMLLGKPAAQDFNKLPFPNEPKAYSWSAPGEK
jgi:pimeloyl-ACP methyl ester carboxylesterase